MSQTNLEIRLAAGGAGVHMWEIAEKIGISEFTFSRQLRHELPETRKQKILEVIQEMKEEKKFE